VKYNFKNTLDDDSANILELLRQQASYHVISAGRRILQSSDNILDTVGYIALLTSRKPLVGNL